MFASERLLEIEEKFEGMVERIVPIELDGETLPHHKHVDQQKNMQPSRETSLEEVMRVIQKKIN